MTDFTVIDYGTLVVFDLRTDAAREWVGENVQDPGCQWLGTTMFAADHRPAQDLVNAIQAEGFEVTFR